MTAAESSGSADWNRALLAAALFAIDPCTCGGIVVRARAGPVRDAWLDLLRRLLPAHAPVPKLPLNVSDDRLQGGLDLSATLKLGRPVAERGLLAAANQGVLLIPSAERLELATAARVAAVLDSGVVRLERDGFADAMSSRFGVIAFDEGIDEDEHAPRSLVDRLAFRIRLEAVPLSEAGATGELRERTIAARAIISRVTIPEAMLSALVATAYQLGVDSARAPLLAVFAARASAAFEGRLIANEEDAQRAAELVLAPRATRVPAPPDEGEAATPPPEQTQDPQSETDTNTDGPLEDAILEAAAAAIPAHVLALLQAGQMQRARGAGGKAGAMKKSTLRGRPTGVRRGEPRSGNRLNIVETLRAAAPWQQLRRRESGRTAGGPKVLVRKDDFRITRYRQHTETTAIFAVDASGSAALHRLAEAKGAVELLLADCYVRRDSVALISFRGKDADLLLPPTRSLVRAKRSLAGLPGGGGTPLAAGVDAAAALADAVRRRGQTPSVIFLTDGKANVARDGTGGRGRAEEDAMSAARSMRSLGIKTLVIDTSPKPQPHAERLAREMDAIYLPLPHADARTLSSAVQNALPRSGT